MPDSPDTAKQSHLRGQLLIVLAAVMWSTSGFFAKAPFFEGIPIDAESGLAVRGPFLAFWRALFASAVLLPMVRKPTWSWRLVPGIVAFVAMNFTFLTAMTQIEAATAIWLQHTAPIWVFLVGVLVLRDPCTRRDLIPLAFATLGVGLILWFELRGETLTGVLFGVLAGMTYAAVVLSLRWLRNEDAAWLVALNHIVTAIVLLPYVGATAPLPSGPQIGLLIAFGALQMGIPYVLFARGLRSVTSHEASGIVLLEPVLVPVWVYCAWRNEATYQFPAWWTLVGGGLILAGLLTRYFVAGNRPDVSIVDNQPGREAEEGN